MSINLKPGFPAVVHKFTSERDRAKAINEQLRKPGVCYEKLDPEEFGANVFLYPVRYGKTVTDPIAFIKSRDKGKFYTEAKHADEILKLAPLSDVAEVRNYASHVFVNYEK
jgi:hypothetical protein